MVSNQTLQPLNDRIIVNNELEKTRDKYNLG
jgi:hypothetical protein